ncbi:MAG TPA: hypothetical protein VMA33_06035, partial [Candidatus Tectomicrobia bacterium]|nr:hypothetical protein [Candidatus Tectomicrobia bacterium]
MLVAQGQQIPTGKLSGVWHLAYESPQQRNHRKKHRHDTHDSQASREPEFVLRFILLYQARQAASSIWGPLSACNMNLVLTQTSLVYSQIERDVCFIIHLHWLSIMEDAIAAWED